jgi:hypothetical protein
MLFYSICSTKKASDYYLSLSYKSRNNIQQRIIIQSEKCKIKKEMGISECTARQQSIQIKRPLISNGIRLGENPIT